MTDCTWSVLERPTVSGRELGIDDTGVPNGLSEATAKAVCQALAHALAIPIYDGRDPAIPRRI
jgi:hypothetical protein